MQFHFVFINYLTYCWN